MRDLTKKYLGFSVPPVTDLMPTSATLRSAYEKIAGPLYRPKTTPGRYAETVGEFVPAVLAGPGGRIRNLVNFAVAPGIASETAGQLTKDTGMEPFARAGAAVATGGAAALLTLLAGAGIKLPQRVKDGIERWRLGRNTEELARLFTDPQAARMCRQLGDQTVGSRDAMQTVVRLFFLARVPGSEPNK